MHVTKPTDATTDKSKQENQPRPLASEPALREPTAVEKLIRQRISEYAVKVSNASIPSNRLAEYSTLHGAFRTLMSERGQSFLDCFKVFINTLRDAQEGKDGMNPSAFNANVYGSNLNMFKDSNEGRAFIAFMVLAVSYSRTNNPTKFVQDKNIGRLTNMLADQELQQIIFDAFSGK